MDLNELQLQVRKWRSARECLLMEESVVVEHAAMVIAEEAGEVLACFSKDQMENLPEELADVVIAAADVANLTGVDLSKAIRMKMQKLETRVGLRHKE